MEVAKTLSNSNEKMNFFRSSNISRSNAKVHFFKKNQKSTIGLLIDVTSLKMERQFK